MLKSYMKECYVAYLMAVSRLDWFDKPQVVNTIWELDIRVKSVSQFARVETLL